MAKIEPIVNISAGSMSATKINDAFDKVETAFANTLSLDGSSPNAMKADLDMNGNDILNTGSFSVGTLIVGGLTQTPTSLVSSQADITVETVSAMRNLTTLVVGSKVNTLGYISAYDGGGATYVIKTLATFGSTPDNLIDHYTFGSTYAAELQHNRVFNAQQCGVQAGVESSTAWNNAFWRAASIAPTGPDDTPQPVTFVCNIDVLTNKTLHMCRQPSTEFTDGVRVVMHIEHKGAINAVSGGTFQTHLNNEMTRLTGLHGSSVVLGSALAAQFLKADPQVAVFLGDKIERPLPILNINLTNSRIALGDIDCEFWCSGIRINRCSVSRFIGYNRIFNYRKYGSLYTKNTNNDIKTFSPTIKQWAIGDATDHEGRMMPGGFTESRNCTGDSIVSCQKDMMWFGGNTGWGRTAVVTLDKCDTVESDRWAGRTMYPDYFTRWNSSQWADHGGSINKPEWDYMAPSTGTGDNDFYGMHVMQGGAETADDDAPFRQDGLDFGGQPGFENWNSTNPVNVYGADIDSSVTLMFGPGIRFFGPTITVGNTAKHACFHPVARAYAARSATARFTEFENWNGSIGTFPFDRGVVGTPNVVSFAGSFANWNYRNRVDSGSVLTGVVQYRGQISGGSGNLPSSSVTTIGDFFWVTEAGTYGGQAMAKGDILYAVTLTPGTSYSANWYLGLNDKVESLNATRTVGMSKVRNVLMAHDTNEPVIWITKPAGNASLRLETGTTQVDQVFDGTDLTVTVPGKAVFSGAIRSKGTSPNGYDTGGGGGVVQITSRTTAVTLNKPSGNITLVSAAGSPTPFSFLVNNSVINAADVVTMSQRTGGNKYRADVTAVNASSFEVTITAIIGTAVEAPIFNFTLERAASS